MRKRKNRTRWAMLGLSACLLCGCQAQTSDTSKASLSEQSSQTAGSIVACAPDTSECEDDQTTEMPSENERIEAYNQIVSNFTEISFDEAIGLFENGKSGLVYFGFSRCPWCEEVVPLLEKAAKEQGVEVLYVKTRDAMKERLYTDEQRDQIAPYIGEYLQDNDEGVPTLYVPLVLAIQDGKVVMGHQGTVEDHDAHERLMTKDEQNQVQKTMNDLVSAMK